MELLSTTRKALALSLLILLSLTASAQTSDGFFRNYSDGYENRDIFDINFAMPGDVITFYGFGEPVPLDGGLLILTVAGAGYAISKRRRTYKSNKTNKSYNSGTTLFAALTLLLLMPSCKKKVETVDTTPQAPTNGVHITLNVGDGSKAIVDPHGDPYATVTFDNFDYIYVGNNGKYCGYLCYTYDTIGGSFIGYITPESENDYLHFYFMGDKGLWVLSEEPTSVDISDQHEKYPVIAYAHSTVKYDSTLTTYTAKLQLYCALVQFDVSATEDPLNTGMAADVTINGMNNVVNIHFDANNAATGTTGEPYTFSKSGDGNITLHREANHEHWGILLPQEAVSGVQATAIGFEPAATFDVPAITAGSIYNSTNSDIDVTFPSALPIGAFPSLFTVNSNGDKVFFSKGDLQYQASTSTWRFAENQYDLIGADNANISSTYDGWIDLFGWGTKDNPTKSDISNDYQWHEWGNNAISNGSNTPNSGWHTLSPEQWDYLLNSTDRNPNYRYAMATLDLGGLHFCKGMILFPDNFSGEKPDGVGYVHLNTPSDYDTYCSSAEAWAALENMGCVFLPAGGERGGTDVEYYFGWGHSPILFYWSNAGGSQSNYAKYMTAWSNKVEITENPRCLGMSVRLVRTCNEY